MPVLVTLPTPPAAIAGQGFPSFTLHRDGQSLPLSGALGWWVLRGIDGLDTPPVTLIRTEPALWDGALHTASRYQPRQVFLPLHLQATDTTAMRAATRLLATLTDPKRGPVTLEVAHPDGTRRYIDGHLAAPLGGPTGNGEGFTWRRHGVTLSCPDPYFYDAPGQVSFNVAALSTPFLSNTFLPVALSESQVAGQVTVTNGGDADAWPVWTITGPCAAIEVSIGDAVWTAPAGLGAGQTMTVTTQPGQAQVTVDSQPAWGRLGPGWQLAPLPPGESTIVFEITGATPATTVTAEWVTRWLTAW
jgi:hypothetical protein